METTSETARTRRRNGSQTAPDCRTCIRKDDCEYAADGTFCTGYRSEPPRDRGEGPSDLWARGEDAPL